MDGKQPLAARLVTNRHLLGLSIVLLLVAGASALLNMPRIEDPRITTRNATVITTLPGASAERVEALVTKKLEDRLREISEIKHIDSTSRTGISVISIELADWVNDSNNEEIFSKIRDKLNAASRDLPEGATQPDLDDKRGAVAYSMIVAVTAPRDGAGQLGILKRVAEILSDRLRNVAGTDQVVLFGEPQEEISVTADASQVAALGLDIRALAQRVAQADAKTPAGVLRTGERQLKLEVSGDLDSVARVASVPIAQDQAGGLLTLGDIATVKKEWREPPEEIALYEGKRTLLIAVRTEEAIRLDQWAARARETVARFAAETGGLSIAIVFDQSRYTEARLGDLGGNLLAGAVIVVLVVLVTMGWRSALIVGAALPLSAAASVFGLSVFGEQIHQMSIFGMIIAIGLLIDNAIVMTDEVGRRLREGLAGIAAVTAVVRHLASPLFASTFTTILGFMPIFLLPGNVGDFVGPIAIAVVLALVASFAISMTIIPALTALLVKPGGRRGWWRSGIETPHLARIYRAGLGWALRHPLIAIAACLVLPAAGFVAASTLSNEFFPPADRDQFEIQVWLPSDASVNQTAARLDAMEAEIRKHAEVGSIFWVAGGSSPPVYYNQLRNQDANPAYARGIVRMGSVADVRATVPKLQAILSERFPDILISVKAFGQGPPIAAPVSFRIVGPELDRLRRYGEQLRAVMHALPEITVTRASVQSGEPKLWLDANEQEARLAGLALNEIAAQFQTALEGAMGGSVLEDLEDLPVRIRYGEQDRNSTETVGALRLVSAANPGGWVPAEALGELALRPELASITRRDGERINTVNGWIRNSALPIALTRAVQQRIESGAFELAPGYRLEIAGDTEEQQQAVRLLLIYVPVLVTLMIALLVLSFRSFALAGLIGTVALLSIGLGMLSLWALGYNLGFNPLIGSAGLIGVAINASIIVLAAIRANPEASAGHSDAIVHETLGSTRHIVSTTLTTVAGFLPLLLFTGGDFWPPLAIVIAGGVGLSIVLGLVFTPVAYCTISPCLSRRSKRISPAPAVETECLAT